MAQILFGDVSPSGKLPYTIYPEVWANNTEMRDMALSAGDGRTYKWWVGGGCVSLSFSFHSFSPLHVAMSLIFSPSFTHSLTFLCLFPFSLFSSPLLKTLYQHGRVFENFQQFVDRYKGTDVFLKFNNLLIGTKALKPFHLYLDKGSHTPVLMSP